MRIFVFKLLGGCLFVECIVLYMLLCGLFVHCFCMCVCGVVSVFVVVGCVCEIDMFVLCIYHGVNVCFVCVLYCFV